MALAMLLLVLSELATTLGGQHLPTPREASPRRRLAPLADAVDYFGVSTKTLRRYIASGLITGYRTGPRMIRVDLNELDVLLARPIPTAGG